MTSYQVGGTHYADKGIQPFDVIRDWCGDYGFAAYLRGNVLKYLCRYKDKGGVEDLIKASHYLETLIAIEQQMEASNG